jgi:hypothetical protein
VFLSERLYIGLVASLGVSFKLLPPMRAYQHATPVETSQDTLNRKNFILAHPERSTRQAKALYLGYIFWARLTRSCSLFEASRREGKKIKRPPLPRYRLGVSIRARKGINNLQLAT